MLRELGTNLNPDRLKPTLDIINNEGDRVLAILDPPHLLKLTRNTLGDNKILINSEGQPIKWAFVERLHDLQVRHGIHLANKVRKKHIDFAKNRMNVSLAAQVISKSLANAILCLCKDMKDPLFHGAEATAEFLLIFDFLFDVMNSKHLKSQFSKSPLSLENMEKVLTELEKCKEYIMGLKHESGLSVLRGRRKAAFVGWLNNIESIKILYNQLILTRKLSFILMYKLSQDPLELFFGCIRASLGYNNNPTVNQFKGAFKRILAGAMLKSTTGNCIWDESTSLLCSHQEEDISACHRTDIITNRYQKYISQFNFIFKNQLLSHFYLDYLVMKI